MEKKNYKGLTNLGATCYMNALLQTLFMTREFRAELYSWQHNDNLHPARKDSILFQLQKLFAMLQHEELSQVSTRELALSFQWNENEAQLQQDLQEFNRVLFQAIEKSFLAEEGKGSSPTQLFAGQLMHYTRCLECNTQSVREEPFLDLILNICDAPSRLYNPTLNHALQHALKPQVLNGTNMYFCEPCGQKRNALRGLRFTNSPPFFAFILQRFSYDYTREMRLKVNDRIQFPFILNFNCYMQGYEGISEKLSEDCGDYFLTHYVPAPRSAPKIVRPIPKVVPVAGKIRTKPSSQTKSFLQEMRRKKKNQSQNFISIDTIIDSKQHQQQQKAISKSFLLANVQTCIQQQQNSFYTQQVSSINKQQNNSISFINKQLFDLNQSILCVSIEQKQSKQKDIIVKQKINSQNQQIFQQRKQSQQTNKQSNVQWQNNQKNQKKKEEQIEQKEQKEQKNIQNKKQIKNQQQNKKSDDVKKQKNLNQIKKTQEQKRCSDEKENNQHNKELMGEIEKILQSGPNVYQLYSVIVHSGTAMGGHYRAYIKSAEDQQWYEFDDASVTLVSFKQINKLYGGDGRESAYVLYYRKVTPHLCVVQDKNVLSQNELEQRLKTPEYLKKVVEKEIQSINFNARQRLKFTEQSIPVKVYFQLNVRTIELKRQNTLRTLFEQSISVFNLRLFDQENLNNFNSNCIKRTNIRLRAFNPISDTMQQTYTNLDISLAELQIVAYKPFILELKSDQEIFQDYIEGIMSLRVALWSENQQKRSLDQHVLVLHKISVAHDATLFQLCSIINQKFNNENQTRKKAIFKRHQNDQYNFHERLDEQVNFQKKIKEVMINENEVLFVEDIQKNTLNESQKNKQQQINNQANWPKQFILDQNRITIKIIDVDGIRFTLKQTDARKALKQLKLQVCSMWKLNAQKCILRRGSKHGTELKDLEQSLKGHRFINGSVIHFQHGLPARPTQVRINLYTCRPIYDDPRRLHSFEYIEDVPIDSSLKPSEILPSLFKLLPMSLQQDYLSQNQKTQTLFTKMRLREKINDKLVKIYRERAMKEQQLIERREIAIEFIKDVQNAFLENKDYSIYIRYLYDDKDIMMQKLKKYLLGENKLSVSIPLSKYYLKNQVLYMKYQCFAYKCVEYYHYTSLKLFFTVSSNSVISEPMFVNNDGLLYIIKDNRIALQSSFVDQQTSVYIVKKKQNHKISSIKQKGVTITVMNKLKQ